MNTPPTHNPLEALRPLHLPPEISWWPPAPGWWLLLTLLLLLTWRAIRYYQYRHPQRAALKAVRQLQQGNLTPQQLSTRINRLLKQYILSTQIDATQAALSGEAWLQFLDNQSKKKGFTGPNGQLLLTLPYRIEEEKSEDTTAGIHSSEMQSLLQLVHSWIKHNPPQRSSNVSL